MAQTVIRNRESTRNIPSTRAVRDVSRMIAYLDPDAGPFTNILQRASARVATNPKFEWFEKDLEARWDQVNNGAGYASGATSIVVDNGAYFSVNDVVNVVRTGEKVRVTAVNTGTNTLTIVRAVGSTVAAAMVDNDDLQIIGQAYAEGANKGAEKSHQESAKFNYVEIFRLPFGVTGTQDATENYTGPDRQRLRIEKMVVHKIDLERSALFGERNEDTAGTVGTTDNPIRYTGGLLYFLTSNATNAGGVLTEPTVETFVQNIFGHTGGSADSRLLLASPLVISVIDQLAAGKQMLVPREKTYGVAITQWVTAHGTLLINKHRLLENGAGGQGYAGFAIAVDPRACSFRYMRGRNTMLRKDIQNPDADAWTDEYLTEAGWEVHNPELHGVVSGVTG